MRQYILYMSLEYIADWFVTREGKACGMMALIIMMKIIFLNGTKAIKK